MSEDPSAALASAPRTQEFQAEVRQLLKLMIHSLYSNREIFLRELISNASDACDKLRFVSVSQPELLGAEELAITIRHDSSARTITISDNGIGMTEAEAVATSARLPSRVPGSSPPN